MSEGMKCGYAIQDIEGRINDLIAELKQASKT
jgi:hypothetical protein